MINFQLDFQPKKVPPRHEITTFRKVNITKNKDRDWSVGKQPTNRIPYFW